MNLWAKVALVALGTFVAAGSGVFFYRLTAPSTFVTKAETDSLDLWQTIAAGEAAQAAALTPSPTAYYTRTPTKTPKPATSTPHATYGPDSQPGIYLVPAWTPTSTNKGTVEAAPPLPCITVTPDPYRSYDCEVPVQ
jgi:hypothetical protein